MEPCHNFVSYITTQEYPIISKLDCSSSNIILAGNLPLICDRQYAGQTSKTLRERFCSHRNGLEQQDQSNALVKHFDKDHGWHNYPDDRFSDLFNLTPM